MVIVSLLLWKPVLVIVWAVIFAATFLINEKDIVVYDCLARAGELARLSKGIQDEKLKDELDSCNSMLVKLTHEQISALNRHGIEKSIELLIDLIGDYNDKSRDDYLEVTSAFKRTLERQMEEVEFNRKLVVSGKVGTLKHINPEY